MAVGRQVSKAAVRGRQVEAASLHFVDLSPHLALSVTAAAREINRWQPHVLVNLNGYTNGGRLEIYALDPAPVQVVFVCVFLRSRTDFSCAASTCSALNLGLAPHNPAVAHLKPEALQTFSANSVLLKRRRFTSGL